MHFIKIVEIFRRIIAYFELIDDGAVIGRPLNRVLIVHDFVVNQQGFFCRLPRIQGRSSSSAAIVVSVVGNAVEDSVGFVSRHLEVARLAARIDDRLLNVDQSSSTVGRSVGLVVRGDLEEVQFCPSLC